MRAIDARTERLNAEAVDVVFGGAPNLPTRGSFYEVGIRHILVDGTDGR